VRVVCIVLAWGRLMRCVVGVAAAAVGAALWFNTGPARAMSPSDEAARFLLFAGTDFWRHGSFTHGGVVWSPQGLNREGFALKAMLGGGLYRFRSGALGGTAVVGQQLTASILPGWRFVRDKLIVSTFAGLDIQRHDLFPDDVSAGLRGGHTGLRAAIEAWYEPSADMMVSGDVSLSTIGLSYSARGALGWRLKNWFYVGPEVQAFSADGNYQQVRAGLHLTGLKARGFEWSAGFGWTTDSEDRDGAYGKLGLVTRR
jgi:hypothetical protein